MDIRPVILCGGSGTRLWPLSREQHPKQLLSLISEHSLLQSTLLRSEDALTGNPIVVCNADHRFMIAEQLRQVGHTNSTIILEPSGRNTAPALALAVFEARRNAPDAVLVVMPSDHVVTDTNAFKAALENAVNIAKQGYIATFGVPPVTPETGYGYIRRGNQVKSAEAFLVDSFVEKPNLETARLYLSSNEYYWNSGIFVALASVFEAELKKFALDNVFSACFSAMEKSHIDIDFIRPDSMEFLASDNISIDYAVMEKTDKAVVIPLDAGWSDIGSFQSLWSTLEHDANGNHIKGDVVLKDSTNCYVHSSNRLVATLGVSNLAIIETNDAILVINQDRTQEVKDIVNILKSSGRPEALTHHKVYRPWGYYETIDHGNRYQVKRIGVLPGASLSLQMHYHRAEHWIVVSGTAEVTCDENVFLVSENESTYIPLGKRHRLHNPGKITLEMIEVQSGNYLGEDDIVRFNDNYGRA
ncbi:mannose-1-phosphate guanylyltransferase (GDP) /mannose-6-phosphate isomerase type 2 [Fluviicoccus keumensis]|uniref:mannose-1-phosphate guanylyltransferase n=1 Tax=Fluviicoccus keumensis TaxID=1435465 RepID=A0A4Q7Z8J3_9GAMM|nr:mannose-1-phosphate guanylyltransferase/mannose-6-phosphate isomerase [Fluviicoccus keumensis]RZU46842.1 mannose-1-phosphate guanylyltransferase (GDP) /mannose-6-phosphate isomerase type 2 [Fluviicoccus keumensis]